MEENILLDKLKNKIENYNFTSLLNNRLIEHFKECKTYYHVSTVVEFISDYSGRICQDHSGEVKPFCDNNSIIEFIEDFIPNEMFDDHILGNLYNGQQEASYCSGYGWHYVSLKDELERLYDEEKYNLYGEFIKENKSEILSLYNLEYDSDEEFEDCIYDALDNTALSDYIVFESYDNFENWLNTITEDGVINTIKFQNK